MLCLKAGVYESSGDLPWDRAMAMTMDNTGRRRGGARIAVVDDRVCSGSKVKTAEAVWSAIIHTTMPIKHVLGSRNEYGVPDLNIKQGGVGCQRSSLIQTN